MFLFAGGAWGLNFVSEKDAKKFYDMCVVRVIVIVFF